MEFGWNEELEAFREEVRAFLREFDTPALRTELANRGEAAQLGPEQTRLREALEDRGWVRMCWPEELGGEGKSQWFQFVMTEEFAKREIPYGSGFGTMVGPAIHRFGTEAQREKYLPGIWANDITLCLGYSEPNAGTDLAALETLAVKDGDDWLINGQKLWTSAADTASHVWLACRTDPDAPKHRGISTFIVAMDTPGISVRPIMTMSGGRTNEVFFEDVRVPSDALIGEVNQGWYIIANALDHERVWIGAGGGLRHIFDRLLAHIREKRPELLEDAVVRNRLVELELDLDIMEGLVLTNASIVAAGDTPTMEASMSKIWTSELRYHISNVAMDLLGHEGALTEEADGFAPLDGELERTYRASPIQRFGGGANEVQRDIIARRGLGLPR